MWEHGQTCQDNRLGRFYFSALSKWKAPQCGDDCLLSTAASQQKMILHQTKEETFCNQHSEQPIGKGLWNIKDIQHKQCARVEAHSLPRILSMDKGGPGDEEDEWNTWVTDIHTTTCTQIEHRTQSAAFFFQITPLLVIMTLVWRVFRKHVGAGQWQWQLVLSDIGFSLEKRILHL